MAFGTMVGGTVGQPITTGYCPGAVVGKFVRTAAFKSASKREIVCEEVYFEEHPAEIEKKSRSAVIFAIYYLQHI